MQVLGFAALLAAAVAVAGCATNATNTLSQARRDALRIESVELSFAPNATVNWGDVMWQFQQSGVPDTPAARKAFLEGKAEKHLKAGLEAEVLPAFRGSEPARLKVTIRRLDVPSAVQRVLVGGTNTVRADVQLLDAKTGQVLVDAPDFNSLASGGGGLLGVALDAAILPDPIDRVSRAFGRVLTRWLKTGQAFAQG